MKVLIDIDTMTQGGAERQLVELAAGLIRRGHQCVLAVNRPIEAYREELVARGATVVQFHQRGPYDARVLGKLITMILRIRPGVVLSAGSSATFWSRLAAAVCHVPSVVAEQGTHACVPSNVAVSNRVLNGLTTAVVACASEELPSLVSEGNRRDLIEVIPNGVDCSLFYPDPLAGSAFRAAHGIPPEAIVVGLVAVHRPEKRHDRFIRMIESMAELHEDVWGCMVGGGDLLETNRAMALQSSAGSRLAIAGPQSDMRGVYSALDIVTLVSLRETLPLCFLEAQACGCPVVGMDTGGVCSTFVPGRSGILVAQGDIDDMVAQLSDLVADTARREAMGECGRQWVTANRNVDLMVDSYEQLLLRASAA